MQRSEDHARSDSRCNFSVASKTHLQDQLRKMLVTAPTTGGAPPPKT